MGIRLLLNSHLFDSPPSSTNVGLFLLSGKRHGNLTAQSCSHLWKVFYKIESRRKPEDPIGLSEVSSLQPLHKAEIMLVGTDSKVTGQAKAVLPRGLETGIWEPLTPSCGLVDGEVLLL